MLFSLIVSLLSATDYDDLSAFVSSGCMSSTAVSDFRPYASFRTTIIMLSTSVSDFRLIHFVHPNSLSVRAIPRIIFFRRPNSLDFNKVVGGSSSIGVISHKNPIHPVLEYALPEA
jgi:hypothetical protein